MYKSEQDGQVFFPSVPYTIEENAEALALFRTLARGGHESLIYGRIAENTEDERVPGRLDYGNALALSGVELTITDVKTGVKYARVSDGIGSYSLRLPESGDYRLTAKLAGHASSEKIYDIKLPVDSCREVNLGMWTASRITGHIKTPDNKPAANLAVEIQPADENRSYPMTVRTDANGKFEFEKIPAGEYVLGVNTNGLNSKVPLDPTFYPGVKAKAIANVVKITGAQTIDGLDFQIGPRQAHKEHRHRRRGPDGRPVINASVTCTSARTPPPDEDRDLVWRYVDLKGEVTCEVLADQDYEVEPDGLSWEHSGRPIQPVKTRPKEIVAAGAFPVHLKFVVDAVNDISATEKPENMAEYNDKEF